jgi:hypothetical protein
MVSTWKYTLSEVVDPEDPRLTRGNYLDEANWHGKRYHLFIGSFYVQYLSGFAETIIARQTRRQEDRSKLPRIRDKEVREFFNSFPRCYLLLQKLLGEKFGGFLRSLNQMRTVDTRSRPHILDKTFAELNINAIEDDGSLTPMNGVLRDQSHAFAIASVATNTAYLFVSHFQRSSVARGATKIHEQFHIFFSANHTSLVREIFGIEPLPRVVADEFDPPIVMESPQLDGDALSGWLARGCMDERDVEISQ